MKRKSLSFYLMWAVLPALFFSSAALAGDKFIIKPIIDTRYMVDSNFYKTSTSERKISTLTISPGVEFGYGTEKSKVAVKALLNQTYYDDLDTVPAGSLSSDENDYTGHHVTLSADTQLFTRITAGIDDTWIDTRSPSELDELEREDFTRLKMVKKKKEEQVKIEAKQKLAREHANAAADNGKGNTPSKSPKISPYISPSQDCPTPTFSPNKGAASATSPLRVRDGQASTPSPRAGTASVSARQRGLEDLEDDGDDVVFN